MAKTEPQDIIHRHLLILAQKLAQEMQYKAYPQEWSKQPLADILPLLFQVLNYHPGKLGDILQKAYLLTFPKPQKGNVNQLSQVAPEYFLHNKQYYLNLYEAEVTRLPDKQTYVSLPINIEDVLHELGIRILDVYASTAIEDENTYRTLNTIVDSLYPLFTRSGRLRQFGFDLWEFQDYWPKMSQGERKDFAMSHFDIS